MSMSTLLFELVVRIFPNGRGIDQLTVANVVVGASGRIGQGCNRGLIEVSQSVRNLHPDRTRCSCSDQDRDHRLPLYPS